MDTVIQLHKGDISDNGQITIVDEDRLCYIVLSESRGASGLRTISKAILEEFVEFVKNKPDTAPREAREALSGQSKIDKYEYGYESTILQMAKMVLGKVNVIHHGMELPFVFNNIALQREMTGGTPDAYMLSDKISSAWISFIKTGNPNVPGLPKWEPYTAENGNTMVFDRECKVVHNHDRSLMEYDLPRRF